MRSYCHVQVEQERQQHDDTEVVAEGLDKHCRNLLVTQQLGGGFNYFLFSPLFGEDFEFD